MGNLIIQAIGLDTGQQERTIGMRV
jgi:hypothetical protein